MIKRNIQFSPPDISDQEIDEVVAAMRSGWITTGPRTKEFERKISEYCGTNKTVCLNSATAALEMSLRILGVGPGDEVITSAYTYTASASVIEHVGAKIVLVDVEPGTYHIDYDALAAAITDKTKVVIPVDIGGMMIDYDKVFAAVESRKSLYHPSTNVYQRLYDRPVVIADAAHSFGASWHGKMSGAAADATCFSFHAVKNLTTAEGGAVTWLDRDGLDNEKLYKEFQLLSLHGQNKDAHAKFGPGGWEYDIIYTGYKCNMTDLTAAFGLKQLERFPSLLLRRSKIYRIYDEKLLGLGIERMAHEGADFQGNYHLYLTRVPGMTLEQRNKIMARMDNEFGIACNVHFKPLPMMTAYKNLGFDIKDYPNANAQFANEITLPMHTMLTNDDVEFVADRFAECIASTIA
ncbi:MAG: DegT/DnrJ/EryC1/StrS family aminotransferase [Clostridia bacterium]